MNMLSGNKVYEKTLEKNCLDSPKFYINCWQDSYFVKMLLLLTMDWKLPNFLVIIKKKLLSKLLH